MIHQIPIEDALDLHPFRACDIPSVVEEYINNARQQGFRRVRLIHGRGIGIQRRTVHTVLRRLPLVLEFWDAPESHLGATLVHLVAAPER